MGDSRDNGPLTNEQISQWLAEPRNHKQLDVELPFGLSGATANIQGLQENPLTRAKIELGRQLYFDRRLSADNNLGVGMDVEEPDLGRYLVTKEEKDKGAFKTPTVRNVELTAPYMHDGSQKTLEEVVQWYDKGGHANPYLSEKIVKLNLTPQDEQDLVACMRALTGKFPKIETGRLPP